MKECFTFYPRKDKLYVSTGRKAIGPYPNFYWKGSQLPKVNIVKRMVLCDYSFFVHRFISSYMYRVFYYLQGVKTNG